MNTYERHRQYRLRKHRTRIIRHRVISVAGAGMLFVIGWYVVARLTPDAYGPPAPDDVGSLAARQIARSAAFSINSVHQQLQPAYRDDAKQSVFALFDTASATEGERDGDAKHDSGSCSRSAAGDSGNANGSAEAEYGSDTGFVRHVLGFPMRTDVNPAPGAASLSRPKADSPSRSDDAPHRELDILLIGLDSRLGNGRGRADALHLFTIDLDAPSVRITSIPRGTYSDLGYENEASNIIANVRSARGRTELQHRVARLCRRDSVPFYVEVGFSDAFGLLELLGYADPVAELQALRQRRIYQYGDHNRCYNQGLFLRSATLRLLPLLEGVTGDVLLRAGLDLVHTNLSREQCRGIAYILNDAGAARLPDLVHVTLRSRFRKHIERTRPDGAYAHAVPGIDYSDLGGTTTAAEQRIRSALAASAADTGAPRRVRERLLVMFRQHGWLQIADRFVRRELRDSLAVTLMAACDMLGNTGEVREIRRTIDADNVLFYQQQPAAPAASHGSSGTAP